MDSIHNTSYLKLMNGLNKLEW
jgi:hypothetical protein